MTPVEIEDLVGQLSSRDLQTGYAAFLRLQAESHCSSAVYPWFDRFTALLGSDNSYLRTRGLLLIAANAQWDEDYKLDQVLDEFLSHIQDPKPTVARQFIAALPQVARYKPELAPHIRQALQNANSGRYKSSMAPLVQKDIAAALGRIETI